MLRKPSWMSKAIPTSVVALVAISATQASHAAADSCLSAPNGAPPKGQHWYYHADRVKGLKCWYLHETVALPAANAVSAGADKLARPATSAETVRPAKRAASARPPADALAQPSDASIVGSNTSPSDEPSTAFAAPNPANTKTAAPLQPASDRTAAQSGAMPWTDPPPSVPVGVQDADATPSGGAAFAVSNSTDTRATTMHEETVVQHDSKPVSAAAPDNPSTNSMAGNLLIIASAAALAAAVSAAFAAIRRRKQVKAEPADFFPRFDSGPDRQRVGKLPVRKAHSPQSPSVRPSLIPEQLTTPRPFVAPWWQERVNQNQRDRLDQRAAAALGQDSRNRQSESSQASRDRAYADSSAAKGDHLWPDRLPDGAKRDAKARPHLS